MNGVRIAALVRRTFLLTFRGPDPLTDFFYWPLFDILIWGFAGTWMAKSTDNPHYAVIILTSLVLWQAVYRTNLDIAYNFLSELWSRNLINLFVTPVTIQEWVVAHMIVGALNSCVGALFGLIVIWFLYGISVISVGPLFILLFILLMFSGYSIGMLTSSLLVTIGSSAQKLVWVMGWFFVPFIGVYYPIEIMPIWAQNFAYCVPMTYMFKVLRMYIQTNTIDFTVLGTGVLLTLCYFSLALAVFVCAFHASRKNGLARLEGA
jgi:ABC-2 type transport system permease protein